MNGLLVMSGFTYFIWTRCIFLSRKTARPLLLAYAVLILLPPLQLGVGIGINMLKISYTQNQMVKAGIELVDIPLWQFPHEKSYFEIDTPQKAEIWLRQPDNRLRCAAFNRIAEAVRDNQGQLIDFHSKSKTEFMGQALIAYYLVGDEENFFRVYNYMWSTKQYMLAGVLMKIIGLDGSPLDNVEFYRRWLAMARSKPETRLIVNRNQGRLSCWWQWAEYGLWNSIANWFWEPRTYRHYARRFREVKATGGKMTGFNMINNDMGSSDGAIIENHLEFLQKHKNIQEK